MSLLFDNIDWGVLPTSRTMGRGGTSNSFFRRDIFDKNKSCITRSDEVYSTATHVHLKPGGPHKLMLGPPMMRLISLCRPPNVRWRQDRVANKTWSKNF